MALLAEDPVNEHSAQEFQDTCNQRLSSVTEALPGCSLLDSVFLPVSDHEIACQPLF